MIDRVKDFVTFFFNVNLYTDYHNFICNDFNYCFNLLKTYDYEDENNQTILHISEDANLLNRKKLGEIKELCTLFSDNFFYFLSGDVNNGVCFKFDSQMANEISRDNESLFFSYLLPYNFWLTSDWCRWTSGGMSDIKIGKNIILDFNHELLVSKKENFDQLKKVYELKYGEILPIIKYKKFLEKIFESEFEYLLSDNIYVTRSSIDYIKKQLDSSIY